MASRRFLILWAVTAWAYGVQAAGNAVPSPKPGDAGPGSPEAAAAAEPQTPEQVYAAKADSLRDPFQSANSSTVGAAARRNAFSRKNFTIKNLDIEGLGGGPSDPFAIFSDKDSGQALIFRHGHLYGPKEAESADESGENPLIVRTVNAKKEEEEEIIPGVLGRIDRTNRRVYLRHGTERRVFCLDHMENDQCTEND